MKHFDRINSGNAETDVADISMRSEILVSDNYTQREGLLEPAVGVLPLSRVASSLTAGQYLGVVRPLRLSPDVTQKVKTLFAVG